MRASSHRILENFGALLAIFGAILFILGICIVPTWKIIAWIGGSRLSSMEFPLGSVDDVAVDSRGRIYVAESFFHRVQRYSPDGSFELGWFVPTAGAFALRTTEDHLIEIATARANKLLTYNSDGQLLKGICYGEDFYHDYVSEIDTRGHLMVHGGLLPRVIESGTGKTVISTNWKMRLIAAPFPAMAYCFVGFGIVGLSEWKRRRRERRDAKPTPSIRHRLRAVAWRQWKLGERRFEEARRRCGTAG